jgi:two-component system alkaline phosphatase synthesis response regulator PhoP
LLEDDADIRSLVMYALVQAGLDPRGYGTASAFWRAMREKKPDIALLDVMLPDEDGLSVLRKLRADPATVRMPVLILTAKGTEFDKVSGLDMGADDYLAKPFGMMELIARVKSLLRRADPTQAPKTGSSHSQELYSAGGVRMDMMQRKVWADGEPVALTFKEFEALAYLMKNKDIVLTREQIMSSVWSYDYDGENRTVDVHIRALRQKLGPCGGAIETVRNVGYRFSGSANMA